MIFYHWTTKEALPSIKEYGLLPCRGQHCIDIRDMTQAMIFLCKEEDLDFWRNCFYDVEVLVSVSVDDDFKSANMKWRRMSRAPSGREYGSQIPIPKEMIVDIKIIDREDFELERKQYNEKYHRGE